MLVAGAVENLPVLLGGLLGTRSCTELLEEIDGSLDDGRSGPEDRLGAGFVERGIILGRDHASHNDHDVAAALLLERLAQRGYQRQVASRKRRHADNVAIVPDCLPCGFIRSREEGTDVYVKTEIGEGGSPEATPANRTRHARSVHAAHIRNSEPSCRRLA